jgi:hypothetical protein
VFGNALPYLEQLSARDESEDEYIHSTHIRRVLSLYAMYVIKPDLYDLYFPSPDGRYTAKGNVYTFISAYNRGIIYGDVQIIDSTADAVVWSMEIARFGLSVEWSQDSRYAAISYRIKESHTDLLDTQNMIIRIIPGIRELRSYADIEYDAELYSALRGGNISFLEWIDKDKVKMEFYWQDSFRDAFTAEYEQDYHFSYWYSGWYIYDLSAESIIEIEIDYDFSD